MIYWIHSGHTDARNTKHARTKSESVDTTSHLFHTRKMTEADTKLVQSADLDEFKTDDNLANDAVSGSRQNADENTIKAETELFANKSENKRQIEADLKPYQRVNTDMTCAEITAASDEISRETGFRPFKSLNERHGYTGARIHRAAESLSLLHVAYLASVRLYYHHMAGHLGQGHDYLRRPVIKYLHG